MSKNMSKKHHIYPVVMLIITALYICFIWWHSTLNADQSTIESTGVLLAVQNFLKAVGLNAHLTDYIIRKSAHFCEFALLGCLSMWTSYSHNKKIIKNLMPCGFVCLSTAVADELIQIASKGRSAEVLDVALDFFGALSGALFFIVIISIIKLVKYR